jgi:hypothetical protein
MKNNRLLIAIGLAVFVVILGIGFLVNRNAPQPQSGPSSEKNEVELTGTIIIDNTDKLSAAMLSEQYSATYDALVNYIHERIDKKIEHAQIVGDPEVAGDGTISFKVKTDNPSKEFSVIVERKVFDKIVVKIPESNFSQTITIYGQGQGED